jgi:uncharacterized protein
MSRDELELLVMWQVPVGKYKGRVIADLPGNCLNWFARNVYLGQRAGCLLALMREFDHSGLRHILAPSRQGQEKTPRDFHPLGFRPT